MTKHRIATTLVFVGLAACANEADTACAEAGVCDTASAMSAVAAENVLTLRRAFGAETAPWLDRLIGPSGVNGVAARGEQLLRDLFAMGAQRGKPQVAWIAGPLAGQEAALLAKTAPGGLIRTVGAELRRRVQAGTSLSPVDDILGEYGGTVRVAHAAAVLMPRPGKVASAAVAELAGDVAAELWPRLQADLVAAATLINRDVAAERMTFTQGILLLQAVRQTTLLGRPVRGETTLVLPAHVIAALRSPEDAAVSHIDSAAHAAARWRLATLDFLPPDELARQVAAD